MFRKLIICSLFLSLFVSSVRASDIPAGVKPVQVTALSQELDIIGKVQFLLTFWNVGQLSDNASYHEAILSGKCLEQNTDGWKCVAEKEENSRKGTFSGGPNGTFTFSDRKITLVNGTKATISEGGQEIVFTVRNPEAFDGWEDINPSDDSKPQTFDEKTAKELGPLDNPEGVADNNDVSITKIYGDVNVSDPTLRRGLFDLTIKAFGTLSGWDSDPEPWRVWIDPNKGMKLTSGFKMKTGDGRAVIQFKDGTKLIIREYSEITIKSNGIHVETGTTIFTFQKIGKKVYVTDKRGKFAIIGTQFEVSSGKDDTLLKVYEGTVETEDFNSKNKIMVSAGEQIKLTDKGPEKKTALSGEKTVDIAAMEKEIIASEKLQAGKFLITVFGIVIFFFAVVITTVIMLKRKK